MNTVSLKMIGDWRKELGVPLRNALAVSVDVIGRTGAEACKHAIILMAQSAAAMTKQAPKNRKILKDGTGRPYIEKFNKNGMFKMYPPMSKKQDPSGYAAFMSRWQPVANRGLAKKSWMWGLRGLGKITADKPIPGVAKTMTILSQKTCGYILQNALSYLLKILPVGWESAVTQKAGNKIMAQARDKINRQWKSEMSRARRGGIIVSSNLVRFFR